MIHNLSTASKISVIIVTHNGEQYIGACIESLLLSTIEVNIIVVDNCSHDRTKLIVQEKSNKIELIALDRNYGFGYANNVGIRKAMDLRTEYFFLLNQDTVVRNDTIEILHKALEKNQEFGLISPLHFAESGQLDDQFSKYIIKNNDFKNAQHNLNSGQVYEVPFVNAAAWMLKKECIRKVGGFDAELFSHYGEDNNYCHRIIYHGFKIGVIPASHITHYRNKLENRSDDYQALRRAFVTQLVRSADINVSSFRAYCNYLNTVKNYFLVLVKSLVLLNHHRFNYLINYAQKGHVFNWRRIADSRRVNKKPGPSWLDVT